MRLVWPISNREKLSLGGERFRRKTRVSIFSYAKSNADSQNQVSFVQVWSREAHVI